MEDLKKENEKIKLNHLIEALKYLGNKDMQNSLKSIELFDSIEADYSSIYNYADIYKYYRLFSTKLIVQKPAFNERFKNAIGSFYGWTKDFHYYQFEKKICWLADVLVLDIQLSSVDDLAERYAKLPWSTNLNVHLRSIKDGNFFEVIEKSMSQANNISIKHKNILLLICYKMMNLNSEYDALIAAITKESLNVIYRGQQKGGVTAYIENDMDLFDWLYLIDQYGIAKHLYDKVIALPAYNEAGELIVDFNAIGNIKIKY